MPSNHIQPPHYISNQPSNAGIIRIFVKPEDGIEGYLKMLYFSYDIMLCQKP